MQLWRLAEGGGVVGGGGVEQEHHCIAEHHEWPIVQSLLCPHLSALATATSVLTGREGERWREGGKRDGEERLGERDGNSSSTEIE